MLTIQPPGEGAAGLSAAVWIDLLQPTAEEIAQVGAATGLRIPTEGQVSEIESSSRLAFEGGPFISRRHWSRSAPTASMS